MIVKLKQTHFRIKFKSIGSITKGCVYFAVAGLTKVPEELRCQDSIERRTAARSVSISPLETVGGLSEPTLSSVKLASALTAGMNPHHPGHSAAYPHHPSLSSSPHHPGPGGPHHAYGTGGRGGGGSGGGGSGGTTTTPDLPSPHSPPHAGGAGDPATPYGALQPGQGMGSNGHHHGGGGMMPDHPHHPGHPHPHMPGHPAYPPVNHNNNCTLKVSIFLGRNLIELLLRLSPKNVTLNITFLVHYIWRDFLKLNFSCDGAKRSTGSSKDTARSPWALRKGPRHNAGSQSAIQQILFVRPSLTSLLTNVTI